MTDRQIRFLVGAVKCCAVPKDGEEPSTEEMVEIVKERMK
jgi:hypothetical protein